MALGGWSAANLVYSTGSSLLFVSVYRISSMKLIRVPGINEAIETISPVMLGKRMEIKRLFKDQDFLWKEIHRPGFQFRGTREGLMRDFGKPHAEQAYYFHDYDRPGQQRRFNPTCHKLYGLPGVHSARNGLIVPKDFVPPCLDKCKGSLRGRLSKIPIQLDDGTTVTLVSMQGCRYGLGQYDDKLRRFVPNLEGSEEQGIPLLFGDSGYVSVGMFASSVCNEHLYEDVAMGLRSTAEAWSDVFRLAPSRLAQLNFDVFELSRCGCERVHALQFVFEIAEDLPHAPGRYGSSYPVNAVGNPVISPPQIYLHFHDPFEPLLFIEIQKGDDKTRVLIDTGFKPLLYPGLMSK
jgi:hypothetical protein